MSVNEKMTELADVLREKSGQTGKLSIDGMIAAAQSIESGGSSIETCTCSIFIDMAPGAPESIILTFVDENGELQRKGYYDGDTITLVKNQLFVIDDGSFSVTLGGNVLYRDDGYILCCPMDDFQIAYM